MNFLKSLPVLLCIALCGASYTSSSYVRNEVPVSNGSSEQYVGNQNTIYIEAGATLRLNNNTGGTLSGAGVQLWGGGTVINLSFPTASGANILYDNIPEGVYTISTSAPYPNPDQYLFWIPQLGESRWGSSYFDFVELKADKPIGIFCSIRSTNN